MKIDSRVQTGFRRNTLRRLTAELNVIGSALGVEEYKPAKDFKTEVLQSIGVGHYGPATSLRLAVSNGGDFTKHPWIVVALVLEFHNRSQSRFRELSLNVSLARFGSVYKVRGTVGWKWPLRVKYETGYVIKYPFSVSDARLFDKHFSNMKSIFISTARRSLHRISA